MERTERFSGARGVSKEIISRSMLKQYSESGRGTEADTDVIEVLMKKETPAFVKIPAGEKAAQGAFVGCENLIEVDYSEADIDFIAPIDKIKTLKVNVDDQSHFSFEVRPIPALIFDTMPRFVAPSEISRQDGTYTAGAFNPSALTLKIPNYTFYSQWFAAKDCVYYRPCNWQELPRQGGSIWLSGILWQQLASEPLDWATTPERYFTIEEHKPRRLEAGREYVFEQEKYYEMIDATASGVIPPLSAFQQLTEKPTWWEETDQAGKLIYFVYEYVGDQLQNVFHGVNDMWQLTSIPFEADRYYAVKSYI